MRSWVPIELDSYCNATAATSDLRRAEGATNAWGNSFPAEELPFGRTLTVDSIAFRLSRQQEDGDHLEALGQSIVLRHAIHVSGLAFLCFGEMGEQALTVDLYGTDPDPVRLRVEAPGWLVSGEEDPGGEGYVCSHLHYVGDYELTYLRPVLWCRVVELDPHRAIQRVQLGFNPLFHLVGLTVLRATASEARLIRR